MNMKKIIIENVGQVDHIERRKELLDDRIQRHRDVIQRYKDKIKIEQDRIRDLREQLRSLT